MQRSVLFVTMVCSAAALAAFTGEARAQAVRTVTCESVDLRQNRCRIPAGAQVRLAARLSEAACVSNQTWGVTRDYVWVSRGCRARFDVAAAYGSGGRSDDHHGGGDHHGGWDGRHDHDANGPSRPSSAMSLERRAQSACARQASSARLTVTGYGGWTRDRGGLLRGDVFVRGHGPQRKLSCTYDPRRDSASLRG